MNSDKATGYSLFSLRETPRRYLRNIKQKLFICITLNKLDGVGRGREKATNICWEPTISGTFYPVLQVGCNKINSKPPSVFRHLIATDHLIRGFLLREPMNELQGQLASWNCAQNLCICGPQLSNGCDPTTVNILDRIKGFSSLGLVFGLHQVIWSGSHCN